MDAIKNLMKNTPNKNGREMREDEYIGEDGLYYCQSCKTPRQVNIDGRILSCICKCQADERDRKEQEAELIRKQKYIESLKEQSLLGRRYNNVTFANTETGHNPQFDNAINTCFNYCECSVENLEEGKGIYLYGDKGTGKTHLTACMVDALTKKYQACLLTNFFEISKAIRNTFKGSGTESGYINKLTNIDFLFIDDLGTELVQRNGEDNWLQEKIFEIINMRYNNLKPTIFTSNHSLNQLIHERGFMEKTVDRIYEMCAGNILKIEGKSFRLKVK